MNELKRLAFLIEVNRQRLHHATTTRNESLKLRTLSLLTQLHSAYFNESRKGIDMKSNKQDLFLVFSDEYMDGITLTAMEYRALTRRMSKSDLATHYALPIDAEMREATEQVLLLDAQDGKNSNPPKPKKSA